MVATKITVEKQTLMTP